MSLGNVSEAREMASLCEEMRGTYREAVASELITKGEYNHLMRRCKRWEEAQESRVDK
tara:strand:- start:254 stop:427 length:174 start_codon:yes stop_codon:yes gene_type:complete